MDRMAIVETSRLLLRLPQSSDTQPLMEIHEDPNVISRVTITAPLSGLPAAWRMIALMVGHWHLRGYGQWTVIERATGQVVGRVGLWNPEGGPGIELGWIIRRSRWGHGFATEAAQRALSWAWDNSEIDYIISMIEPDNAPAIRDDLSGLSRQVLTAMCQQPFDHLRVGVGLFSIMSGLGVFNVFHRRASLLQVRYESA